jgi:hypothetical protein
MIANSLSPQFISQLIIFRENGEARVDISILLAARPHNADQTALGAIGKCLQLLATAFYRNLLQFARHTVLRSVLQNWHPLLRIISARQFAVRSPCFIIHNE